MPTSSFEQRLSLTIVSRSASGESTVGRIIHRIAKVVVGGLA